MLDRPAPILARHLPTRRFEWELQIPSHCPVGVQRIGLESHCHVALLWRKRLHALVSEANVPRCEAFDSSDELERRRLPCARSSQHCNELAVIALEAHAMQRRSLAVLLLHLVQAYSAHGQTHSQ